MRELCGEKKKEEKKMSRLSFRPRPLDIHKKLPIVKSVKDFEDDETPTSTTRNSQMIRLTAVEVDTEVPFSLLFLHFRIMHFLLSKKKIGRASCRERVCT